MRIQPTTDLAYIHDYIFFYKTELIVNAMRFSVKIDILTIDMSLNCGIGQLWIIGLMLCV